MPGSSQPRLGRGLGWIPLAPLGPRGEYPSFGSTYKEGSKTWFNMCEFFSDLIVVYKNLGCLKELDTGLRLFRQYHASA